MEFALVFIKPPSALVCLYKFHFPYSNTKVEMIKNRIAVTGEHLQTWT
jgi:hypothetical protein